jgi:hypothetical protein
VDLAPPPRASSPIAVLLLTMRMRTKSQILTSIACFASAILQLTGGTISSASGSGLIPYGFCGACEPGLIQAKPWFGSAERVRFRWS